MSDQDSKLLKKMDDLMKLLQQKENEISDYKTQLYQLSHQLDEMIAADETELNALRKLFQHLVPTELPQINGFEFSRKFVYGTQTGGDYFDLFLNKDKFKWSLLISSAPSYGTSAIVLSQIINHSALFSDNTTPVQDKVQKFLADIESSPGAGNFSLFFGQVDRRDLGFEFCCLGDISGVITHGGMTQIISAESRGATGRGENTGANTPVKSLNIGLEPKTKACFVTPGVLEVLPIQKIAAICQSMAHQDVHQLRNEIFFQAEQQSRTAESGRASAGSTQPRRDQIVFVFEIKENLIKIAR